MRLTLVPARRRGVEILDASDVDPALRARSHKDIALSNALFGGTTALLVELRTAIPMLSSTATLVDVGTGTGEATSLAERFCGSLGVHLRTVGVDFDAGLARAARRFAHDGLCASALELPLADESVDIVTCSQVAHHFEQADLRVLVAEMDRVARHRVIISDLRRSFLAVAGLWASSFPLMFHPVSRHDGVVSILRGFTGAELRSLVYEAVG
ncbi:MAG: methyltransferase domain-containing protein, partial [Gemmatimonadaceae bacterium]